MLSCLVPFISPFINSHQTNRRGSLWAYFRRGLPCCPVLVHLISPSTPQSGESVRGDWDVKNRPHFNSVHHNKRANHDTGPAVFNFIFIYNNTCLQRTGITTTTSTTSLRNAAVPLLAGEPATRTSGTSHTCHTASCSTWWNILTPMAYKLHTL